MGSPKQKALPPMKELPKYCPTIGPGPIPLPTLVGYVGHDISKRRGPAFSLGRRISVKPRGTDIPAPVYDVRHKTRFGPDRSPAFKLKGLVPGLRLWQPPGPGTYSPENFRYTKHPFPPAFTIRGFVKRPTGFQGPGPQYLLPDSLNKTGPLLNSRLPYIMKSQSPGPATYKPPSLNCCRWTNPAARLFGKPHDLKPRQSPSPLDYVPRPNGPNAPKFSFGVRRHPCTKPFIIPEDNMD